MEMKAKFYVDREDFYNFLKENIGKLIDISKIPENAKMNIEIDYKTINVPIKFTWNE